MNKKTDKLQKLTFVELHNIFNFLKSELETAEENERDILKEQIEVVREELKRIVNNLF